MTFVIVGIVASIFTVGLFVVEAINEPDEPIVQGWMLIMAVTALSIIGSVTYMHYSLVGPERTAARERIESGIVARKAERAAGRPERKAERLARYPWLASGS